MFHVTEIQKGVPPHLFPSIEVCHLLAKDVLVMSLNELTHLKSEMQFLKMA